jgi:putative membrane protein
MQSFHRFIHLIPLAATIAISMSASAFAQTPAPQKTMPPASAGKSGSVSAADRGFVDKAAAGGMAEVAAGELAQQKASSDSIKSYGKHLVDDHTKANDELKEIAGTKGVDVPSAPDAAHETAMAKMQALSGADFDRAFKAQMIADHQKTIGLFKQEASAGKDADLKAFAGKTLPTLQEHLKMAQALK